MEVEITVDDARVRALLNRSSREIDRAMRAGMTDATVLILRRMRTYPPQRIGSTYKRTNTLKGSWSRTVTGTGASVEGRVSSNGNVTLTRSGESYNRLVQDATQQARVHRGRWTNTAQAVARDSTAQINEMFRNRIDAALR